jgi:hypothetical protein
VGVVGAGTEVKEVVVMEIVVAVAAISITHGGVSVISNIRFESIIDNRHQLGGHGGGQCKM